MKVVVVTYLTPTPENRGGISALLYALLRFRPKDVEVVIFSFNLNQIGGDELLKISKDLSSKVTILGLPSRYRLYEALKDNKWFVRFAKFANWPHLLKALFDKKNIEIIAKEECDLVLLYPMVIGFAKLYFPNKKLVIVAPDCWALVRGRSLMNFYRLRSKKMFLDDALYYYRATKPCRSKSDKSNNVFVHYVGMADYNFHCELTSDSNAHFLLHPFVKYNEKFIDFTAPQKLKVIIPGAYDMYYATDVDKMLESLIQHKSILLKSFEFTFLGKHWSPIDQRLKEAGFDCEFKTWVDDYAEELVQHDIQITPISFGTGTKGKVLDAMVNGLLVIGSDYALENICVRDMESCVRYRDASHIASILISVANHRERYQAIAEKGRAQVLKYHDPTRISKRFFEIYYKELTGKKL